MTSTPVSNLAQAQGSSVLVSKTGKLWIAVLGLLFLALHWHFFRYTAKLGMRDPDWSHVLIIPLISLYYISLHRQRLMATPRRVCPAGLAFIYFGITGYIIGSLLLRNPMAQGYSMITTLFGVVLLLLGPAMMRVLWFPIAFLVFSVNISDAIWSVIASRMQNFAAHGATLLINLASSLTDMDANLKGSTIHLDYMVNGQFMSEPMNVAEACGGMRMLMAFLALGVALAFLFPRQWWQRLIMVALAAPIAIFVNALRVAVLGWLHLIDKTLSQGDFHVFVGMLMLIPAAGLLMLVGWCLEKVVIIEGKPARGPAPLPFDNDPEQVHLEPKPIAHGLGVGLVALAVFAAVEVVFLQSILPALGISTVFAGKFNLVGALSQLALHLTLAVGVWLAVRMILRKPRKMVVFGSACGMLLAGLLTHAAIIQYTGIALSKLPLDLRHPIALEFPDQAGDWQRVHQDPKLSKDVESELGTKDYFNSYYVNNAKGYNKDNVVVHKEMTPFGERLAGWSGIDEPGQFAKVHIAYYTGMLDTVPHVPDKCWIVAGQQLVYREPHLLTLSRDNYRADPQHPNHVLTESTKFGTDVRLPARKLLGDASTGQVSIQIPAIIFSGADPDGNVTTALYLFLANGEAIASSHEVRLSFNLKDKYSYYCKVEVMFPGVVEPAEVQRYAEDLLSDLMPEIMACLPDWTEVQAGTYPLPAGAQP